MSKSIVIGLGSFLKSDGKLIREKEKKVTERNALMPTKKRGGVVKELGQEVRQEKRD